MNIVKSRSLNKTVDYNSATIETTDGNIEISLLREVAPLTVINFIKYVKIGQYDNTIFHRVVKNFMIQGGEYFDDGSSRKPTFEPVPTECYNLIKNEKGAVAMARNKSIQSAKCQFFINAKHNKNLDGKYTVFARVNKGIDVVEKINKQETQKNSWPKSPTKINKIVLNKV